jgi:tetratricopeptide (TPR) repeat protein
MFWSARGGAGLALLAASFVALLSVPRPEWPDAIPYPPVDHERAVAELQQAMQEAAAASQTRLHVDIRGVGERVRRCGALEVSDPQAEFETERTMLRESVLLLLQQERGAELVRLRELQARLLFEALTRWLDGDAGGALELELSELGARLPRHLESVRDWFPRDPYFEQTVRALFVHRWGLLVGFERHPSFEPSANDWRLIHRFRVLRLLRAESAPDPAELRDALTEVAKYSPDYPYDYATGIAYYRAGAFQDAVDAFGRHLERYPASDWAVRAQNFRLEAARALVE